MNKLSKFFLAFLIILSSIIGLLLIDDPLSPEVKEMYAKATAHKKSEAFVYLLGMQAAADEDPQIVGESLLKSIRDADDKYLEKGNFDQEYEFEGYSNKKISSFTFDTCETSNPDKKCSYIEKLFNHKFDLNEMDKDQTVILKRFNEFLSKDDFQTITTPHLLTPFPPYQYMIYGNDLSNLIAVQHTKNGDFKNAEKMLSSNISRLRNHLEQADNLIAKMIFVAAISRNLDVLFVLNKQSNSTLSNKIKPLTPSERSLEKAMNYELGFIYNTTKMLSNDSYALFNQLPSLNKFSYAPAFLSRLFYKPNMTINNFAISHKQVADYSLLSNAEYSRAQIKQNSVNFKKSYLRNYIGTILNEISTPEFKSYISRVFSLDAKIQLFNKVANIPTDSIRVKSIKNPFYPDTKNAYFTKDKKSICFDIPHLKREEDKCLRLKP